MIFNLIYGRSGTGKSEYIYRDIKNRNDNKKIYVIVPEQSNLFSEKKIFEITHKTSLINIEVLTLSRMAYRIMSENQGDITQLSKIGKNMIIYDLINKEKLNLKFLGKTDKNIDIVNRLFTEFKKHNISKSDLKNAEILDPYIKYKLNDIVILYEKYEERIKNNYIDENDSLNIVVDYIDKTDMFDNSIIYIDDFLGFTPQEYNIFEKLVQKCSEIFVSICVDNLNTDTEKENDIFYFNKKYARKLIEIAENYKAKINKINLNNTYRFKNEELKFLEKNLYNNYLKYEKKAYNINLFLASNPYTEIEYVARNIHNLVKKSGYLYREIAIITQDIENYSEEAKAIFRKYNIPVFIDEKKELNQNILIKFIISMLDIFSKNWSYDSIFNYLKTGLFEIDKEEIYLLENYCKKWGIKGNKWFNKDFDYEPINDVQERLECIRKKIVKPLVDFKEKVSNKKTVDEISKEIYYFIINNKINEILDNKIREYNSIEISDEYNTSYNLLINVLDEMCLIFKNEEITFEKYKELLQVGLSSVELGRIPATQDQVVLGDIDRTRSNNVKIVFVIGLNDGNFPKRIDSEGYLNDKDREVLKQSGIEIAKTSVESLYEEQFNIYRTLTLPEEKLFLSYCSSDKEGKSIRASILIKKIKRIFENISEESDIVKKEFYITNEIATFEEALDMYKEYLNGNDINSDWENILRYFYKKNKKRFEKAISGIYYTNKSEQISNENIKKLYGKTLYTSISKLENYRRCPFSFHLTYGLKLKEKEELKIRSIDTGTFMHEVIDKFFKIIDEKVISVKQIEKEQIYLIVNEIINELLETNKYYIFSSSAKFRLLTRRLKKVVTKSIEYIVYSLKYSDFSVLGHEIEFSNTGYYKPIIINLEDRNVEITGKIDRVDIAKFSDKQYVRIIDYKSSYKDLDLNQVLGGLQIQLITYLDAITKQNTSESGGILYLSLIDNIVKSDKNLTEEEIENKIRKNFRMKGLILADVNVVKMMDTKLETGYSDIVPAYIGKDGCLSEKKSSILRKDDFKSLQNKVKEIIKEISKDILNGRINILPYNYKGKKGCDYCKYKSICMFNPNLKDNDYFYISDKNKEFILSDIRETERN